MSSLLLRVATASVRGWTRLYTWHVPAPQRDARRQEVASDLWESAHDPDTRAATLPFQMLARLVIGMVDDMRWRFEHVDTEESLVRRRIAVVAVVGILWVGIAMAVWESRPEPLPDLPQLRLGQRMLLIRPAPPPPPPPPPPCAPEGLGPQTDCTR